MGKFITELQVKQVSEATYKDNAIWELTEPLIYESDKIGLVIVKRGVRTNFSSVPRVPLLFLFAGGRYNTPAALHDKLYDRNHQTGACLTVTRLQADNLIFESILDSLPTEGYSLRSILMRILSYPLASISWLFVRCFGWRYWVR